MIVPYPLFLIGWIKSSLEKLSEKGFEQYSECELDPSKEDARSRKGHLRQFVRLGRRCVRDFSDSFRRGVLGSSPQASRTGILLVVERDDPPKEEWVGKEERHVHRTT
jgi:hypothetical protein